MTSSLAGVGPTMREERAVLIQISDLHFGADRVTSVWKRPKGYFAHDDRLCRALWLAIEDLYARLQLDDDEEIHLLVSGDLSVSGTRGEFSRALEFLTQRSALDPRDPTPWGLGWPRDRLRLVPGNHDHWDGHMLRLLSRWVLQRAYNRSIFPDPFPRMPALLAEVRRRSFIVRVIGVDSLSGFAAGATNLLARGSIAASDRALLRGLVGSRRAQPTIICVMLHHSLRQVGTRLWMHLDSASRDDLLDMARTEGIHVFLSGHEHTHSLPANPLPTGNTQRPTWEVRSQSTTQGLASFKNGFLVHLVEPSAGHVTWTSLAYGWNAQASRFRPRQMVTLSLPPLPSHPVPTASLRT